MEDKDFTTRAPEVGFEQMRAGPPGALYAFPGEQLVVDSWSSYNDAPLHIKARVLTPQGTIQTSYWLHTPTNTRALATTYHDLAEGWLLHVEVLAGSMGYRRGHCFVRVTIQRGQGPVGLIHGLLITDYITSTGGLVWPGGLIRSSVDGPGLIRMVGGVDPAPGAEVQFTVPANARWRLQSVRLVLVTDATAVNREADLVIDDGVNLLLIIEPPALQGANGTRGYNYGADFPSLNALTQEFLIPLPVGLILLGGYRIRTVTAAIVAGDNYGPARLLVEEWIEP